MAETDLISRQAVIEINRSYHGQMPNEVNHRIWKEINELPSAHPERMTNFERITQSESALADWLYYGVNCDWCPISEECVIDDGPINDRCFRLICDWLKSEA